MRNKKYRIGFLCLGLFLAWNIQAQVGKWKIYRAYYQATLVAETPNLVFGVYDGSLLSYNPDDGEVRTYSSLNGLHGTDIQLMAYYPGGNVLILVYSDANIDFFMGDNNVYNLSTIKDRSEQDKTLYNLEIIGDYAYLSTAYGIEVIDIKKREVKGTYRLDMAVRSVCQQGDYLYAATPQGIKRGLITTNLLDKANWEAIEQTDATLNSVTQIVCFKDQLFFLLTWNQSIYMDSNEALYWLGYANENIRSIKLLNDQLVVATDQGIYFYSDIGIYTYIQLPGYSVDCINSKNQYWLACGDSGLTGFTKQPDSTSYKVTVSEIKVNSPKRNLNAYMTFASNKLIVTGGGKGGDRLNLPGTLMVYENGQWYNFDENVISDSTKLTCLDLTSAAVDPQDPMHYYVGSWGEGLYEFRNNEFVKLYSYNNSSLQTTVAGNSNFIRVDGVVFDKNNNLYVVNGGVPNGLSVFLDQKEWKNFYYKNLSASSPDKILISSSNQKWFNFYRPNNNPGIMVLDDNGTVDDPSDDNVAFSGSFVDQQGVAINATVYLAMAEDQNGLVWVGTDNGPIYFTSMNQVAQGVCNRIILANQYDDGYRPLEGMNITSIAVDGGNRKWIGTTGSGVFVIDQSGSDTRVDNYTTDNSYLLSNTINSIAINNQTGEVFIGTDKGLCSYQGEAIAGKPDYSSVYAYPNPVRPDRNSQVVVTGLMQNSTIKITDVAGNLVQQGVSMGGQYIWNCADRNGTVVKAGIYLVFAATPNGSQGVATKIMVIR